VRAKYQAWWKAKIFAKELLYWNGEHEMIEISLNLALPWNGFQKTSYEWSK